MVSGSEHVGMVHRAVVRKNRYQQRAGAYHDRRTGAHLGNSFRRPGKYRAVILTLISSFYKTP